MQSGGLTGYCKRGTNVRKCGCRPASAEAGRILPKAAAIRGFLRFPRVAPPLVFYGALGGDSASDRRDPRSNRGA